MKNMKLLQECLCKNSFCFVKNSFAIDVLILNPGLHIGLHKLRKSHIKLLKTMFFKIDKRGLCKKKISYKPLICKRLTQYSKRDLNPHGVKCQRILSPSCLPIPPFERPYLLWLCHNGCKDTINVRDIQCFIFNFV